MPYTPLPRIVYPEWYGALCNGTNDDAVAINAAITDISATGGTVQFLSKKYYLKSQVNINSHCITLQGNVGLSPYDNNAGVGAGGPQGTQLVCTNGINGIVIQPLVANSQVNYPVIRDLGMQLPTGATSATVGISILGCLLPKINNVRLTHFSTGIYLQGTNGANADSYIDNCYITSIGVTVNPVIGIDIASASHIQNESVYISRTITAHGSYSGVCYGYYLHGNCIADTNFDACEGDGCTIGFYVDGSAGIDAGLGADIHFRECAADGCITAGFKINNVTTDGMIDIDGGWAAEASNLVWIVNSQAVTVRGMQLYGGTNGIYFQSNSAGQAIGNVLRYQTGNMLTADGSNGVAFIGNKAFRKTAGSPTFIALINNAIRCVIMGNSVDPSCPAGSFGFGIDATIGSDYTEIIGNDMATIQCTTPYSLNLSSNIHIVWLDSAGTTISGGGGTVGPTVSAYQSTAQSIPNATWTNINLQTVNWDTNSGFASSTYTIPTTGYYQINANVALSTSAAGEFVVGLIKNGVNTAYGFDLQTTTLHNNANAVSAVLHCTSGDTLNVGIFQNTGAAQNTVNGAVWTRFDATYIRG